MVTSNYATNVYFKPTVQREDSTTGIRDTAFLRSERGQFSIHMTFV